MTDLVFLVDVDNTLLDNDGERVELEAAIASAVGQKRAARFWEIYEAVRTELDFVSFPETLERFGRECDDIGCLGSASAVLYGFSFAACLYHAALGAIDHLKTIGQPVILSDGDQLFQRHKIRSAGLEAAFDGRVLVYVHKELETADIMRRYPAERYVLIDDKPRIHAAMKGILGDQLTTVQVRQGKYARAPRADLFEPDITVDSIGDIRYLTGDTLRRTADPRP